ncbi:RxLR effector protein [Phytophthora megakarya]|uniref:RxLR effector protein n=1 Tax=Phytophthora megakarya TaxID=4795 RepID=A0A225WJU1_9STRA|nr:RxLR effector protein [Phytophthora megakarya]
MLRSFTTSEENDDERVFTGLSKATNVENLKKWLKNGESVDNVFTKLQLGKGLHAVANPNIKYLDDYVTMFNNKNPKNQVLLVDMLSSRYGDGAVATALMAASSKPQTHVIADKLLLERFLIWMFQGNSAADVAKKLKIGAEGSNFVSNTKVLTLTEYMNFISAFNPRGQLNYAAILRHSFGNDNNLATAVMKAAKTGSDDALYFQKLLFKDWYSRKIEPSKVPKTIFDTTKPSRDQKSVIAEYTTYHKTKLAKSKLKAEANS